MSETICGFPVLPVERLSAPTDMFRCQAYRCSLMAKACIKSQYAVHLSGNFRAGRGAGVAGYAVKPYCAQECQQGRSVAARFPALAKGKRPPAHHAEEAVFHAGDIDPVAVHGPVDTSASFHAVDVLRSAFLKRELDAQYCKCGELLPEKRLLLGTCRKCMVAIDERTGTRVSR